MTYHVIPIGLTVLVFYLYTLYLSSTGFITRQSHRRFWNWVLLAVFTVTGLFGLFMALKINYKWDLPFYDQLLNWHVEAGISMTFVAIIHLVRNLSYYFGRGSRSEVVSAGDTPPVPAKVERSSMLLLLTGFVSSSSQFIMMREAVILGGGTEVSAAMFLWVWLIFAAAGAMAGNRSQIVHMRRMIWTLLAATALAPVAFIMMNVLLLNRGETATLLQIAAILAVSVAPVTFIASLVFIRLSVIRNAASGLVPGNSFGVETAGSVAAGVVTAMTVTLRIPNYELYLLILLLAAVISVTLLGYRVRAARTAMVLLIPLALLVITAKPDLAARGLLLRDVTTVKSTDTPFGNITTANYGGEQIVFYDHRPLFFSSDVISREENIHYALLQRESYRKVMLIAGGLRKHLPELGKYNIAELVYLEHDPGVIAAENVRDTVAGGMRVTVVRNDPITEMRESEEEYDAVLQLIPPPSTLAVTRFYTVEYFQLVKEHLSDEGIFLSTPMPYYNYSPESYRKSFSPLYNALDEAFNHIALIPGSALYAVASDRPVTTAISHLYESRSLENSYVNSDYLDDGEIRRRGEQIILQVDREAGINSTLRPVSSLFANILSLEQQRRDDNITGDCASDSLPFYAPGRSHDVHLVSCSGRIWHDNDIHPADHCRQHLHTISDNTDFTYGWTGRWCGPGAPSVPYQTLSLHFDPGGSLPCYRSSGSRACYGPAADGHNRDLSFSTGSRFRYGCGLPYSHLNSGRRDDGFCLCFRPCRCCLGLSHCGHTYSTSCRCCRCIFRPRGSHFSVRYCCISGD